MPDTLDQQILAVVQQQFGSSNFDKFQAIRYVWYSKQTYPAAGSTSLSFFGDVVGQNSVTNATTNMTRANSFSQRYFLMRAIRTHFYMNSTVMNDTASMANTYLAVAHNVVESASWLTFSIQDKEYLKIANPLSYMPYGGGFVGNVMQGEVSTNKYCSYGTVGPRKDDVFVLEPPQLIEAETTFKFTIEWSSAVALPGANTGTIGIWIDGIVFRPLQ